MWFTHEDLKNNASQWGDRSRQTRCALWACAQGNCPNHPERERHRNNSRLLSICYAQLLASIGLVYSYCAVVTDEETEVWLHTSGSLVPRMEFSVTGAPGLVQLRTGVGFKPSAGLSRREFNHRPPLMPAPWFPAQWTPVPLWASGCLQVFVLWFLPLQLPPGEMATPGRKPACPGVGEALLVLPAV